MLSTILRETAERLPDKTAFTFGKKNITYRQLDQQANNIASKLLELGLQPQDRVGIYFGNCLDFVAVFFGVVRANGVAVPLNTAYKGEEIKSFIQDSDIKYFFTSQDCFPIIEEIMDVIPSVKHFIVAGGIKSNRIIPLEEMQDQESKPVNLDIKGNESCICLYTSGTTGKAKGILYSNNNALFILDCFNKRFPLRENDHALCVIPLSHGFSLYFNILMPVSQGISTTIHPQFNPNAVLSEITNKKISFLTAVPGMYAAMLSVLDQTSDFDISSLRICVTGGSALPREVYNAYLEKFGIDLTEGSGPSEAPTFMGIPGANKPGSVGKPLDGVTVKVVDNNNQEVPQGEIGELCIKGPNVMQGYHNMPEATAEVIRDGWYHTGDIGRIDEDGYVYLISRKKDMIIVGGLNVFPKEVEDCICNHPKVSEAAVIGIPDTIRGQIPKAFVVLKPGENSDKKEIILYCRKHLANHKCPREVVFVDSLPKNAMGKVDKTKLQ